MKRWIGGTVFSVVTVLSVFLDFFMYVALFFLIVGIYELIKIYLIKKKNYFYFYFYVLVYLIGIFCMISIYLIEPLYVLILIGGIMLNDTFAYFVGKWIGKTKFSSISPNKTIEGLLGGMIFALVIMLGLLKFLLPILENIFVIIKVEGFSIHYKIVIILLFVFIFAVIGDLAESKLKRLVNIKDSGTIVYGHGGILDRIDSWVVAAIPTYILLYLFI